MNIYDFSVKTQDSREVNLSDYKGKVLLVVNTATGCGFTPQYDELQDIYDEFKDKGFEILDFPCNQFGDQAPGDDEEIHSFCTGRYGATVEEIESKLLGNTCGRRPTSCTDQLAIAVRKAYNEING